MSRVQGAKPRPCLHHATRPVSAADAHPFSTPPHHATRPVSHHAFPPHPWTLGLQEFFKKLVRLDWLNSKMIGVVGVLSVVWLVMTLASFRPLIGTLVAFKPLAGPLVALTNAWQGAVRLVGLHMVASAAQVCWGRYVKIR